MNERPVIFLRTSVKEVLCKIDFSISPVDQITVKIMPTKVYHLY